MVRAAHANPAVAAECLESYDHGDHSPNASEAERIRIAAGARLKAEHIADIRIIRRALAGG